MSKQCVRAKNAPEALGPYSHAVRSGGFLYLSGQIGLDPANNTLVPGGVEEETRQALSNISSILAEQGLSPDDVVKTTVFLRDMGDFSRMNEVYGQVFSKDYPARTTVQVAALPKYAAIEIEAVAALPESATAAVASRRVAG